MCSINHIPSQGHSLKENYYYSKWDMEKVIRVALDIFLYLLLKNTKYLTRKRCTRCSPPAHFIFYGQLSQPHCYLAPPEAMTAFNREQWLTEHMLWGLEGRGVPCKKPIHSFRMLRQEDAHLSAWPACCRGVHPNTRGTWLSQPPPCSTFPEQLHQQELQCPLMKLDIWHPEGPPTAK